MRTCIRVFAVVALAACSPKPNRPPDPPREEGRSAQLTKVSAESLPVADEKLEPVFDVGGGVTRPRNVSSCNPSIETLRRISGSKAITQPTFIYEITVSSAGRVTSLSLKRATQTGEPYDAMEREFRRAIENCQFKPGTRNGKPVAVRMIVTSSVEVR